MPRRDEGLENDEGLFMSPRYRRRRDARRRRRRAIAGVLTLIVAIGAGIWLWLRSGDGGTEGGSENVVAVDTTRVPPPGGDTSLAALPDTLEIPELESSDGFIREVGESLSRRPDWTRWLVGDDVVRRFVTAVVRVSGGRSPASVLQPIAPEGEFRVRESEGRTVIAPESYDRYDALAATFASLDPRRTAWLYRQLHPLFEEAHQDLGFPEGTFDEALSRAVENVLAVEIPDGPVEVVAEQGSYRFRDSALESRSAAAKQLLRMGPGNARRVQTKLRELAAALEISTSGDRSSSPVR